MASGSPANPQPDGAQALVPAAQAQATLSPAHKRYRQLQQHIEKAQADLQAWDEQTPLFAQAYRERVGPLLQHRVQLQLQLVRQLNDLLAGKGRWNKPDQRTLRRALCERAADLALDENLGEADATEMKVLHDRHAEHSLDAKQQEHLDEVKAMLEEITGLDLGEEPLNSEDDLRERAQRKIFERAKREAEQQGGAGDREGDDGRGPAGPGGPGGAQRAQSARARAAQRKQQQQAEAATKSVREVFRKLASALHPDRAADEDDRGRRTALMQRANRAYTANDLLALLKLQLELEQVDTEHVARASSQHLQHINRVLAEQLEELRDELLHRSETFAMEFAVEPWIKLNPRRLEPLLTTQVRELQAALAKAQAELRQLADPAQARRWVAQARREQHLQDEPPFAFPF